MSIPSRHAVRVLLLNDQDQLLLMCANDPSTSTPGGHAPGRYWFTAGGQIDPGESVQECAIREIYEETGLTKEDITLGPVVWKASYELMLLGNHTQMHEQFIVARTHKTEVKMTAPTNTEAKLVEKMAWFSKEDMQACPEVIYPLDIQTLLPPVLAGEYPQKPIDISQNTN